MSEERLDRIEGLLQELVTKQALHASEQNDMRKDLERVVHVLLEGNGKPALTEQMLTNTIRLNRLEEERSDKKMPRAVWTGLVVSIVFGITGCVTAIASLI